VDNLPPWYLSNPHKKNGYRPPGKGWGFYASSIFAWHNETVDIWSHMVASIFHLCVLVEVFYRDGIDRRDRSVLIITHLTSVLAMYVCSSFAHCFYPRSSWSYDTWWLIDQLGIVQSILGGGFGAGYFGLSCFPEQQAIFLAVYAVGFVCLSVLLSLLDMEKRLLLLIPTALLSWGTSIFTMITSPTFAVPEVQRAMFFAISAVPAIGIGLFFYLCRLPEQKWPGKFDTFGNSHNIWHFSLVVGGALWWFGLMDYFYQTRANVQICPAAQKWI
jgi:adiponectin receptor